MRFEVVGVLLDRFLVLLNSVFGISIVLELNALVKMTLRRSRNNLVLSLGGGLIFA